MSWSYLCDINFFQSSNKLNVFNGFAERVGATKPGSRHSQQYYSLQQQKQQLQQQYQNKLQQQVQQNKNKSQTTAQQQQQFQAFQQPYVKIHPPSESGKS